MRVRLGKANTKRRQLLKYHQEHRDKIARNYNLDLVDLKYTASRVIEVIDIDDVKGNTDVVPPVGGGTYTGSKSGKTGTSTKQTQMTTVSTYQPQQDPGNCVDLQSIGDQSHTTTLPGLKFVGATTAGS